MTYQPLHHKYRPQTFQDLVGQEAIATTLTNAIRTERIAPAYLFTGSRGTGKTSSARILAKSLNCLSNNQPTEQPCGNCTVCQGISKGSILDVIEIDAASNTGVDNIRELIERAQFAPVQCRYKVYVIDECHMLSGAAFNALLKTLEEPPDRVVFVLATTDPQRVLPTIISRCQRFDFRRIPLQAMVQHLREIADKENINITDEAITLVAQFAQGGLRDAESLLDQLSLLTEQITVERVWDLVGAVPERDLLALLDAIASQDTEAVIQKARDLMDRGREPLIVLQNLASFYRDLLIAKTAPQRSDLVAMTAPTWNQLCQIAQGLDNNIILYGQKYLKDSEVQIKNTSQPRLWLEVTLLGLFSLSLPSSQPQLTIVRNFSEVKNSNNNPKENSVIKIESKEQLSKPEESQPSKINNSSSAPSINNTNAITLNKLPQPEEISEASPALVPAEEPKPVTSNSQLETGVTAQYDLKQIWQQVVENISPPPTQEMVRLHCFLLDYKGETAIVGVKTQPILKLASGRASNIEEAFFKAFNRRVKVSMQVGTQSKSQPTSTQENVKPAPVVTEPPVRKTEAIASTQPSPQPLSLKPKDTSNNGSKTVVKESQTTSAAKVEIPDEVEIAAQRLAEYFQGEIIKITEPTTIRYSQIEEMVEAPEDDDENDEDIDF